MTIDSNPQHHSYNEPYEHENTRLSSQRPIFNHTDSSDSISYQQQQQQGLIPQQASPHRLNMSSQPTTPKPSSATTTTSTGTSTPTLNNSPSMDNSNAPLLDGQKYNMVTPNENNTGGYSPHTNSIRTTAHRKDSVVPNINETCPSFGPTEYNHNIISMDRHSVIDVRLHTKVDRGFFLAEDDWTCYRRNYFQVSGSFSLEGVGILYEGQDFPCLVKDPHGQLEEIHCFMLGVTARLSDCDKTIQLIQHTPKRDKGPQTTPSPKPIRPGGNIGFSAVGSSQSIVTFERLQFKTATANNGKRRAAQQYYVIIVELLAKLRNGNTVPVATTKSAALVVRGRSPGHYAETDSGVSHSIAPKQHRGSHGAPMHHHQAPPPPPPQQPQEQHHQQHVPPFGRPTAYAGASPNLFQPTEYMPYDYHGVTYANYGHMPPHQQHQQQQQPQYPNHSGSMMPQPSYVHDRTHSSNSNTNNESTVTTPTYPTNNNNNNSNEYGHEAKEEGHHHTSSPYYWQRSNGNHHDQQQQQQDEQQHHHQQQEHWNRMRMTSNNTTGSSSVDNSQHGSPYMNHPLPSPHHHQQQQQQQPDHAYYAHHQYGGYGHHSSPTAHR
ncbi:unnamed protein product [Mucor hiemalis]